MSDQIDISREVCNEMAFRLHRLGEYEVAQLEGYSLWPFADIILALRAALDAAEAERVRVVEALHFYADFYENPNDGPWGINSEDFGKVARTALKAKP